MKSGAQLEQGRHSTVDRHSTAGRGQDAGCELQEGALPRPVAPDNPNRRTGLGSKRNALERPELFSTTTAESSEKQVAERAGALMVDSEALRDVVELNRGSDVSPTSDRSSGAQDIAGRSQWAVAV